jgi:hypothetical protein
VFHLTFLDHTTLKMKAIESLSVRNRLPSDAALHPRIPETSAHCYDTSELNMRC